MNRNIWAMGIALILLAGMNATAQSALKKPFTMTEAVNGMSSTLAVQNLKQLQWMGNDDLYSYVVSNDSVKAIYRVDPSTPNTPAVWATLTQLNNAMGKSGFGKIETLPAVTFRTQSVAYIQSDGKIIQFEGEGNDLNAELIASIPAKAEVVSIDPNNLSVAYVNEDNLWICEPHSKPRMISRDGSRDIVYGKPVHRDEFGIDRGIFWSPAGNALAFYRMDQSMVEDYPIVDWSVVPAVTKNIKYPFAGRTSHQVSIGVYRTDDHSTTYLDTGEPLEQYLTAVSWSPDEQFIYVGLLNRDQNHLKLNTYDATTGDFVKTIFEERNDRYVEPQHPLTFPANDPDRFLWWSQRDGYMHFYLYDHDTLKTQLTSGSWIVNELLGYNALSHEVYFTASKDNVMQKNVYAVNMDTKAIRNVSSTGGTHTALLSPSGNYLLDNYSNKETPRAIDVIDNQTKLSKRILTAPNTLGSYRTARVELVRLTSADGSTLYGKLILPDNLDSSKKYPVIVYLYNGPHVQLNKDAFPYSGNLWYDYMTQKGYIVFVVDGHGSANRGFEFESAVHRQLGTLEMDDQLLGVNYLKKLPFVDATRMGVHGWSFGGFMTTSLMLRKPGTFKCGVAGGPVLDWSMYEVMYTERYMDTPQQNPEGYKNNLLLDKVKNLQGKLLMIHGTDDDVVVWEHSLKFVKKCVDEGVQIDYFVYPGHPHNVRGKDRVHLMQKISDYFDANLK